jgi:hypothetical protein
MLAPDSMMAKGTPWQSVSRWRLVPGLLRSVGLGPMAEPPFCRYGCTVHAGPLPVELIGMVKMFQ